MWAQTWGNIDDVVKPFPDAPTLSATAAMQEQVPSFASCEILQLEHNYESFCSLFHRTYVGVIILELHSAPNDETFRSFFR